MNTCHGSWGHDRPGLRASQYGGARAAAVVWLLALAVATLSVSFVYGQGTGARPRRIAVFGSSVANGTGDELAKEGYTGRLRELLAPRGWEVLNQSRGGDNTQTMAPRFAPNGAPAPNVRYLLPVAPSYVLLGLSLGNEGIRNGATQAEKDVIFRQFETGMKGFVERSRQNNIIPIVTLCYTRNDFTTVEYEYTRRMNLLINTWDVSSVNFLGAIDDGTGKWARGFWFDSLHPNATGHVELTRTFVPTLFEALERGKPIPRRAGGSGSAKLPAATAITFAPSGDEMHPFALGFTVRAQGEGSVAAISGSTLGIAIEPKRIDRGNGRPPVEFESATLTPGRTFSAGIAVENGVWTYRTSDGARIVSRVKADASWHDVLVSHYTARGETLLFVDGALAGTAAERLEPRQFTLGGARAIEVRDLLIYRSALNADEAAALHKGALLQASLEVYSPLANLRLEPDRAVENLAQSMTSARVAVRAPANAAAR
jgi:lysophospholipase L1-like esterase